MYAFPSFTYHISVLIAVKSENKWPEGGSSYAAIEDIERYGAVIVV